MVGTSSWQWPPGAESCEKHWVLIDRERFQALVRDVHLPSDRPFFVGLDFASGSRWAR
jgi:hypothetical protein